MTAAPFRAPSPQELAFTARRRLADLRKRFLAVGAREVELGWIAEVEAAIPSPLQLDAEAKAALMRQAQLDRILAALGTVPIVFINGEAARRVGEDQLVKYRDDLARWIVEHQDAMREARALINARAAG